MNLGDYLTKFKELHVDKNKNRYSAGKAPHKPILLLSLILLSKNNKIDLSDIKPNIYLRETWAELWKILSYNRTGPIYLPLYHLRSDGFWKIEFKKHVHPHQPRSIHEFNSIVSSITLDDDLIDLIDDDNSRNKLINSLLNGGYFSEIEINNLKKAIRIIDRSFDYEKKLILLINDEFKMSHNILTSEFKPSRDPAFRRIVLTSYNETCSVCGVKLITSSGISIIDAAHILPFSQYNNDDIRNGMALCKTHHWLFDKGLISVDDHYRVLVSGAVEEETPESVLTKFNKNDMIMPNESSKYPSQVALDWHRERIFQR